jgi:hypothetical protein
MTTNKTQDLDIGDDLVITKTKHRISAGGAWVCGRLNGHRFDALVFPEHADNAEWEIGDSKISKLFIQRLVDKEIVFNWDRGMDVPAEDETAQAIVDFLCAGLADHTFCEGKQAKAETPKDTIERIAREILGLDTLEVRNRDRLDFHELGVCQIRDALDAAFEAGRKARG